MSNNTDIPTRILHPYDMIIQHGTDGFKKFLSVVNGIHTGTATISLKFDGTPALVFGRLEDGSFFLTDKAGWNAKGYDGKATTKDDLYKMLLRGDESLERRAHALRIANLWDHFEALVPNDVRGVFLCDLLYVEGDKCDHATSATYKYRPNISTYALVSPICDKAWIAVHSFRTLDGYSNPYENPTARLNKSNDLLVTRCHITYYSDDAAFGKIAEELEWYLKYSDEIDHVLDSSTHKQRKISDFKKIFRRYAKHCVDTNATMLLENFINYVNDPAKIKLTSQKRSNIINFVNENADNFRLTIKAINHSVNATLDVIDGLDCTKLVHNNCNLWSIHRNEGYVISTHEVTIKFVDYMFFRKGKI